MSLYLVQLAQELLTPVVHLQQVLWVQACFGNFLMASNRLFNK